MNIDPFHTEPLTREQIIRQSIDKMRLPDTVRREDLQAQAQRPSSSLDTLAKAAVVAGGGYLLLRGIGRRNVIRGLSGIGSVGKVLDREIVNPVQRLMDSAFLGGQRSLRPAPNALSETDLVRELRDTYAKVGSIGPQALDMMHSPTETGVDIHRAFLSARYTGGRPGTGPAPVRVSDVLGNRTLRGMLGQDSATLIDRAVNQGLITPEMSLSRSSTFGLFHDQGGRVYDTQWAHPLRLFDKAHNALRQIQVLGMRPADLVFGAIRPMMVEANHTTIGMNMTLPNGINTGRGLTYSMGGSVYSQIQGTNRFEAIGHGLKVYDVSRPGSQLYARALSAMDGTLANTANQRLQGSIVSGQTNPVRNFWQRIQGALGVGPEFATSRSIPGDILDANWRRQNINTPGAWIRNAHVPYRSTLTTREVIRETARVEAGLVNHNGNVVTDAEEWLNRAVPNRFANFEDMPLKERLKAYAGKSRMGDFYLDPPDPRTGFPGRRVGEVPLPRTPMQGFTQVPGNMPRPVGPMGIPANSIPATGVVGERGFGNSVHLFMHHMTERLNTLIGQTTGIGIRPSPGKWGWISNFAKIYGIGAAAKMGLELGKYGDYLAGEAKGMIPGLDGDTPSEEAVKLYTKAMTARQKLRETLGIQQSAKYMEDLMPGSMSLPGSWVARTVLPPVVGAYHGGRIGAITGGIATFLIGGGDVEETSAHLSSIYSGKKMEPVYNSRWWAMGLQPWNGNKIDYYQPNWAARYTSNFRYTGSQYGSKSEYFSHASSLPTPHNLFGILNLLDPDYYARKHSADRPYPFSPSGERMHEGEDYAPLPSPSILNAAALGYGTTPGTYNPGIDPSSLGGLTRRTTNRVTEMFGLYKFLAEQMPGYDEAFGADRPEDMYAANAATITSGSREYYDEQLGGGLGMSELLRRYLDPQGGKQGINRIPNTMPSWLPGVRSAFPGDRDYFTDFTLGDPYASIPMGEARLPGPGYEALHALHSSIPGVYDAYDAYKILADVAPYSDAFRNLRTIVQSWIAGGALDKSWMQDYEQTESQVQSILDGPEYTPRRFSGVRSGTVEQLATVNKYSAAEKAIGAGWEIFTHDIVPNISKTIPFFGQAIDRKLLGQRSAFESYLEDQVYGTSFQDWRTPYQSFLEPKGKSLIAANPVTATLGGMGYGALFGATPLGATVAAAGAVTFGSASAARAMSTGQISGGWIPDEYKERAQLETYFDALQYERAGRNKRLVQDNPSLANQFRTEQSRTAVGFDYNLNGAAFYGAAKFRLGAPMKNYAWQFLQAPEGTREEIMRYAPEMAQPILASAYRRQGDIRYSFRPEQSSRQIASNRLDYYGTPEKDWSGWSPDVPMDVVKVKTLDSYHNEAYDMHKHSLWEYDRRTSDRSYPSLRSAF